MQVLRHNTKKFFDNTLENIEKNVQNQTQATVQSTKSQFVNQTSDQGTNESGATHPASGAYDEVTRQVVEDFYAPSDPEAQKSMGGSPLPKPGEMTPEEQEKYQKLRKQLHDEVYYSKLMERKSTEQEHVEEEQQDEQEQQMEELQLEEKKKKDDDIAVRMQTNRAEQFPGASG